MYHKKVSKNGVDVPALKRELLDDLDQFLLDADSTHIKRAKDNAKAKALVELDKLIKQDLSQVKLLTELKKTQAEVKKLIEAKPVPVAPSVVISKPRPVGTALQPSAHVLDLRRPVVVEKDKEDKLKFYLEKIKILKEKIVPKAEEPQPKARFSWPSVKLPQILAPQIVWPKLSFALIARKTIVFALIIAIVLLPIRGLVFYQRISGDKTKIIDYGKAGLFNLQTGVISASENSYDVAQTDFQQALTNFQQAQNIVDGYNEWLIKVSSWLPGNAKSLSLGHNILSASTNISEAAAILNKKIQTGGNPTEYIVLINEKIQQTLPYLEGASNDLNGISLSSLPADMQTQVAVLRDNLPNVVSSLKTLEKLLTVLTGYLGHDTEKRYLVLFQNNNELRATGGFIGSFALFDVYQGKIVNLEIPKGGTYDLTAGQKSKIQAPQALSLINPYFNIWDANWWPDFPTSAKKIADLYQNNGGSTVDGVIAINSEVLRQLLSVLGPIYMEDYGATITADNLYDVIQQEVEVNAEANGNKPKAIIADLVPIVMQKLLNFNDKQMDIVATLAKMLDNKNIQLYSTDDIVETSLKDLSWAGQLADNDKDFLGVISTNIAGGKTDNNIAQTIEHQAEISANGEIIDTVRVTRTNNGPTSNPFAGIEGGNVSYLRFYVPLNSQFIDAIGFDRLPADYFHVASEATRIDPDIAREESSKVIDNTSGTDIYSSLNKSVFGNWMTLKSGESKTVSVKYKLPIKLDLRNALVNDWWSILTKKGLHLDNYSLVAWKQAGTQNTTFNSAILLPDNVKIIWNNASDPKLMSITEKLVTYNQNMDKDIYYGFILVSK